MENQIVSCAEAALLCTCQTLFSHFVSCSKPGVAELEQHVEAGAGEVVLEHAFSGRKMGQRFLPQFSELGLLTAASLLLRAGIQQHL